MPVCFPHELAGYNQDDYEGVQLSLLGLKVLRQKQKEYSESNKAKIDQRRARVPRRGSYPKGKKPVRHIRRENG